MYVFVKAIAPIQEEPLELAEQQDLFTDRLLSIPGVSIKLPAKPDPRGGLNVGVECPKEAMDQLIDHLRSYGYELVI